MMKGGHGPCKLTSIYYYYSSHSAALCISYHIKGSHDSVANRVMNILYAVNVSHTHTLILLSALPTISVYTMHKLSMTHAYIHT